MLAVALLGPDPAAAHGRSHSYSTWEIEGGRARVRVRLPRVELTRLGPLGLRDTTGPAVSRYLSRSLELTANGEPCAIEGDPAPLPGPEGWSVHGWRLRCASDEALRIESRVLLEAAPSHLHFARVTRGEGEVRERVLHDGDRSWSLGAPPGSGASQATSRDTPVPSGFLRYVELGVEHILTGWDHLAFVFALLLMASRLGEVAGLVSGFTVGHSLTLALAVLGLVRTEAVAVEAVIAFSVALVAVENVWDLAGRRTAPIALAVAATATAGIAAALGYGAVGAATWLGLALFAGCHFLLMRRSQARSTLRSALAFAFGLIHGFGFAGVLGQMELPADRLAIALFGFNVGVEVGQLGVVLLAWPLLLGLARLAGGAPRRWATELGSAAIAGLGLFWLALRAAG
ncbi:MAG: HupE/UreJ family protein [Myxococcota bacterium]